MSGRRSDVVDIHEILRRLRLGQRDRRIAGDLHISRKTVGKYHAMWSSDDSAASPRTLKLTTRCGFRSRQRMAIVSG